MTVKMHALQQKKVHLEAVKLYSLALAILKRMHDSKEPMTSATFAKIDHLEGKDSLE